jgi:FMN phosphatase YigB (HAD superfamily)
MATLVFWLDVDNTLINNDEIKKTFDEHIRVWIGLTLTERFWEIYEEVRAEESVVDIPQSLKRFREETTLEQMDEDTFRHIESIFDNFPFQKALYPQVLETLKHLRTLGLTVIVSDGDRYFQAEKIVNSTLADAVDGRVLIYIHKQEHVEEAVKLWPADHYIIIDDKATILADIKKILQNRLTTVFVEQGKYAQQGLPEHFVPDIRVSHIGDLLSFQAAQFLEPEPTV